MDYISDVICNGRKYSIYKVYSYIDTVNLNGYKLHPLSSSQDSLRKKLSKLISFYLNTTSMYLYILIDDPDLLPDITMPLWVGMNGVYVYEDVDDLSNVIITDFLDAVVL